MNNNKIEYNIHLLFFYKQLLLNILHVYIFSCAFMLFFNNKCITHSKRNMYTYIQNNIQEHRHNINFTV